jgi:hypothetical protein
MPKPCTCAERDSFIGCPAHDAAMRTPAEVAADIQALRAARAERATDPRLGRFGGVEDIWNEYGDAIPEGAAS